MMRNSAPQVFAGGWKQMQHAIMTENEITFTSTPKGHHIKPDGMILFTTVGLTVESIGFGIPWIIDSIIPATLKVFNITEDTSPRGVTFSPDGTIMVIVGNTTKTLYSYILPVPFDITSIVDTPTSLFIPGVPTTVEQCVFSTIGDFIFVTNQSSVVSLPLPTPFDITSNVSFTEFTQGDVVGIAFKPEGDKMYLTQDTANEIREYDLPTLWNITTAVFTGDSLDTGSILPESITAKATGLEFFLMSISPDKFTKFHLEDEWHIETGSLFKNNEDISMVSGRAIQWAIDGSKFYILQAAGTDTIDEFSVPFPHNTTGAVLTGTFVLPAANGNNPTMMYLHPDGTRIFVMGTTVKRISQYNMSTAFDISTMSYSGIQTGLLSLSNPHGMTFGMRGKKCYVVDNTDDVMEYDLGTAYDLTTFNVTELQKLDVEANSPNPGDIVMHPDDKSFFLISVTNMTISRYVMSEAGNITTGVFADELDISAFVTANESLAIRMDNGKMLFFVNTTTGVIFTLDMSLEFNNTLITELGEELITELGEPIVA